MVYIRDQWVPIRDLTLFEAFRILSDASPQKFVLNDGAPVTVQEAKKAVISWYNSTLPQGEETVPLPQIPDHQATALNLKNEEITVLNVTTPEDKGGEIRLLGMTIVLKDAELALLKLTVEELRDSLQDKDHEIADLNATVDELQGDLKDKDEEITLLDATIEELRDTLEDKEEEIADLNVKIDDLQDTLEDKEEEITDLKVTTALKIGELALLNLDDKDDEIADLKVATALKTGELTLLNLTVDELQDTLDDKDEEIALLQQENLHLQSQLALSQPLTSARRA